MHRRAHVRIILSPPVRAQVPFKFSVLEGFGKERTSSYEAVPVEYAKFISTVKKGVEGVVFEPGGNTAIALTGEGNTMLRTEVKARATPLASGSFGLPSRVPSIYRPAGKRTSSRT